MSSGGAVTRGGNSRSPLCSSALSQASPSTADTAERRFELRQRSLLALIALAGQNVELVLGGGGGGGNGRTRAQTTTGVYRSWSSDGATLHVSSLGTPLGTVPEALLRGTDVAQVSFVVDAPTTATTAPIQDNHTPA